MRVLIAGGPNGDVDAAVVYERIRKHLEPIGMEILTVVLGTSSEQDTLADLSRVFDTIQSATVAMFPSEPKPASGAFSSSSSSAAKPVLLVGGAGDDPWAHRQALSSVPVNTAERRELPVGGRGPASSAAGSADRSAAPVGGWTAVGGTASPSAPTALSGASYSASDIPGLKRPAKSRT
jgi:hypothetical protein